jgi:hypothetical protein
VFHPEVGFCWWWHGFGQCSRGSNGWPRCESVDRNRRATLLPSGYVRAFPLFARWSHSRVAASAPAATARWQWPCLVAGRHGRRKCCRRLNICALHDAKGPLGCGETMVVVAVALRGRRDSQLQTGAGCRCQSFQAIRRRLRRH